MSKKIINCNNYFTRSSSHSMTGSRRAFLEILPPNTKGKIALSNSIFEQKETLQQEAFKLKQIQNMRRLSKVESNRLNSIKGQLGNINKTICLESIDHYEEIKAWVFWRLAQQKMEHNIFREIDIEAEQVINNAIISGGRIHTNNYKLIPL